MCASLVARRSRQVMTPNDLSEFTKAIAIMAQAAKYALCQSHGGPADTPPVMLWHKLENAHREVSGDELEICALPMPSADDETLSAPNLFYSALTEGFVKFGKPAFVGFVSEAYMRTMSDKETKFQRGDLQRAFQDGVTDDINEILSIVCFTTSGEIQHQVIIVKYDDNGLPMYEELSHQNVNTKSGAIVDVINDFLKFMNLDDVG